MATQLDAIEAEAAADDAALAAAMRRADEKISAVVGSAFFGGGDGDDEEQQEEEAAAAVRIQALQRGKQERRELADQRAASVKIQAIQRGKRERKDLSDQKTASVKIQVRLHIIRTARIEYVGRSQSCMVVAGDSQRQARSAEDGRAADRAESGAGRDGGGICSYRQDASGEDAATMRVELFGHFKPCMTDIYLHI